MVNERDMQTGSESTIVTLNDSKNREVSEYTFQTYKGLCLMSKVSNTH